MMLQKSSANEMADPFSCCVQSLPAQFFMVSMKIVDEQMHWLLLEEQPVAVMALPIHVPAQP